SWPIPVIYGPTPPERVTSAALHPHRPNGVVLDEAWQTKDLRANQLRQTILTIRAQRLNGGVFAVPNRQVENLDTRSAIVDAKNLMRVVSLGAK
ncbi:hypothetical protein, partial [Klebsiella pneumoniae]|uniref:hypothetical protein n=1 Tax=Klebsiella pneumoniae TaxID=573 RepID=UPI00210B6B6B